MTDIERSARDPAQSTDKIAAPRLGARSPGVRRPFPRPPRRELSVAIGELVLALTVLGLAVFLLVGALQIRVSPMYAHIGPRFFPMLVGGGLGACALVLFLQALRRPSPTPPPRQDAADVNPDSAHLEPNSAPVNWRAVFIAAGAVVIQALLIERAGFIISSTTLFAGVAVAFGSRRYMRDALVGFGLSLGCYAGFTRLLGLHLPAGIVEIVIRALGGS